MKISARVFVRGFVLIVLLVAGGWLLKTFAAGLADEAWVDAHIRGPGMGGDLVFIAIALGIWALVIESGRSLSGIQKRLDRIAAVLENKRP